MADSKDTIMEFPCEFPIKAIGYQHERFANSVLALVQRHCPSASTSSLTTRPSHQGRYLAVTITITADSRQQLDAIYMDLTACDDVLMAI